MHVSDTGWRLHAVHHSPTRLHVLAAGRTHPFNAVVVLVLESIPVLLLGITPTAFAMMTVFKGVNGQLQHSNVDLRPGWLSHVVATSEVHRWHHSVDLKEGNTNFGNATVVWDKLFGTFFLPKERRPSTAVGLAHEVIPESYWAHMGTPFRLQRYRREQET